MPHNIRDILQESTGAALLPSEEKILLSRADYLRGVRASNRGLASRQELLHEEMLPVRFAPGPEIPLKLTGFIGSALGLRADERGLEVARLEDSGFCFSEEERQLLEAARQERGQSIRTALSRQRPGFVLMDELKRTIPLRDLVSNMQDSYGPPEELEVMLGIAVEIRAGTLAMRETAET